MFVLAAERETVMVELVMLLGVNTTVVPGAPDFSMMTRSPVTN